MERYVNTSDELLGAGKNNAKFIFNYDGDGVGKGGDTELYINDKLVTKGRIERTQPNIFSTDETADVGLDNQTPVAEGNGYGSLETTFIGKIDKIHLSVN